MQEFTVNIYPIKNGAFLTSFTHPLTKKKVREHFASRTDAMKYKEKTENRFERPDSGLFKDMTIEELLYLYNVDKPKNSFVNHTRSHLIDFVDTFGSFKVDEVMTDTLKVWLDQIQKENNLRAITMRALKCDIDAFFKYLVEKDIISESPLTTIYYAKSVPRVQSRNILSEHEIALLLNTLKIHSPGYLYPMMKLITETAARTAEVADLVWKDIDLSKGEVRLVQTTATRERILKISSELVEILSKKKSKQGYVFTPFDGNQFTKNKIRRAVDEFKVKSKSLKDWVPMDVRHSFAVNFLIKGGDIKKLQYILGHDRPYQTKQLYGEVLEQMKDKIIHSADLKS